MKAPGVIAAWFRILGGNAPLMSIEITRECPLHCPGCYAYNESHLPDGKTLRTVADFRGDELVDRVLALVDKHKPLHVSLVGGEPLIRHRELSRILPELQKRGVFAMVVTSAIIPIPMEWMSMPSVEVVVSIDGLPEHHDVRRKPASYEKILHNLEGRNVVIHWTITAPMMEREGYLDEYLEFWMARPEVRKILVSTYTPQVGEHSPEMLTAEHRAYIAAQMERWRRQYPKVLVNQFFASSLMHTPASPKQCTFARMSVNYTADLSTRVEPCILGGAPDCSQCGCAASVGIEALRLVPLKAGLRVGHLVDVSVGCGTFVNKIRHSATPDRWRSTPPSGTGGPLVSITSGLPPQR